MAALPVLAVESVTVRLGGRDILFDVDLQLHRGEFMGLIGGNGAGKTTLLRAILGLIPIASGAVLMNGKPRGRRFSAIGYVPQRVSLDPDLPLRARDLVALGVDGGRLGIPLPSRARRFKVDQVIDAVDAGAFANERVGLLSGGEQQRVLIAHALAGNPRALLLDEPLANLDLRSERRIVDILRHIATDQHVVILMSTHDINPLLGAMDTVAYVASGRLASGRTEDVATTESLSRLYGHHVDVIRIHDRIVVVAGTEGVDHRHSEDQSPASVL